LRSASAPASVPDGLRGPGLESLDYDPGPADVLELLGVAHRVDHMTPWQGCGRGEDAPSQGRCSAQQSPPQRVEAEGAQVQCPAVEFLEIESRDRCGAGFVSDVLPQPLADLVARCLSGPPEVDRKSTRLNSSHVS